MTEEEKALKKLEESPLKKFQESLPDYLCLQKDFRGLKINSITIDECCHYNE